MKPKIDINDLPTVKQLKDWPLSELLYAQDGLIAEITLEADILMEGGIIPEETKGYLQFLIERLSNFQEAIAHKERFFRERRERCKASRKFSYPAILNEINKA